jgi:hypothetical protein
MAEVKTVELKITTNIPDASKKIDGLKTSIDGAKESTKDLKKETETVNEGGFNKLGKSLSNLSPAFQSGIEGAKTLGVQLLALAANPIGATILAVVGAVTLLYKAFASTNDGADKLEQIMDGLGAVLNVLRDRVLSAGKAIANFFSGDFKVALAEARKSVGGLGSEIEKEFKQAATAKRYLQEVEDSLRSLSVSRARLNRDLARSKEIITDENASYAEKKKAIEAVRIAEEKQTQAELRNAEKKLKAIKLANSLSDVSDENLDKQAQAEAELFALQEKSASDRRAIRKTEIRADKEEAARLKAIADERAAKIKEEADKRKAANEKALSERKEYINKEKAGEEEVQTAKDALVAKQNNRFLEEIAANNAKNKKIVDDNKLSAEAERLVDEEKANSAIEFEKKKNEAIANSKANLTNIVANLEASGLAKTKAGQVISKAIALTQIGIDSAVAISKASTLANAEGVAAQLAFPLIPGIGTIARVVSYASTAASVIGNIARAKQLLSSGGNAAASIGVGGGGNNGGSAPAAPAAPTFNVVGTSGQNQIAQSLGNQSPVKAYVVANDVSSQQSLDRNIVKTATLGN